MVDQSSVPAPGTRRGDTPESHCPLGTVQGLRVPGKGLVVDDGRVVVGGG